MTELRDLSKWIYYTGLFLNDFDKNLKESEDHQRIFKDYLDKTGFAQNTNFYLWNQGTILMLLYGLFVLPKEFWVRFLSDDSGNQNVKTKADRLIFENFEFSWKFQ